MKKLSIILISIAISLTISCRKQDQKLTNEEIQKISVTKTNGLVLEYVKSNSFIDINLNQLQQEINDRSKNKFQKPELAKAKAAIYRFYKNVSIKDGQYVHHLKNGKELNISEELYLLFSNNIKTMNKSIDSLREKKINVQMPPVDAKYLNSLLN